MSDTAVLPEHVGIILDGNRRWAKQHNLPTLEGHRIGSEVFKDISLHAFERGVKYLSAYVFSTENWSRAEEEISYLMGLVAKAVERFLNEFNEHNIKIVVLGRRDGVEAKVLKSIDQTIEKTKDNDGGTLALCFNYGGQEEIADAVKDIISQGTKPEAVTPELLIANLYHPEIPAIDLLIRTSGEHRLSGFMLYRSAYAEFYFSDVLWPDFKPKDFDDALADYAKRNRRFGA